MIYRPLVCSNLPIYKAPRTEIGDDPLKTSVPITSGGFYSTQTWLLTDVADTVDHETRNILWAADQDIWEYLCAADDRERRNIFDDLFLET